VPIFLWITGGLGCDGDSVSITAATQPSIEDVPGRHSGPAQGAPAQSRAGLRKRRRLHEVLVPGRKGKLDPFVLVVEGSIPNEKIKKEGYWAALGTDPRPASRSPPASGSTAWRPRRWRWWLRNLRHLRRHSRHGGQSHRLHGPGRLSRLGLEIEGRPADRQRSRLPGAARQLHGDGALPALPGGRPGADDSARRSAAPTWLFGKTVHEGCDRAGYYEQGDFADEYGSPKCIVKLGCWGPVVNCNVPKRGWMAASAAARTSAASASAAPCRASPTSSCRSWTSRRARAFFGAIGPTASDPRAAFLHQHTVNKEPKWRHPRRADHRLSPELTLKPTQTPAHERKERSP
jgi:hydrogenase small subunit